MTKTTTEELEARVEYANDCQPVKLMMG